MRIDEARRLADQFLEFCHGVEAGGSRDFARRGRLTARALVLALDELEAERSARLAIQAQHQEALERLARRVFPA